jgi:DNA-binding response OmpR family regulator
MESRPTVLNVEDFEPARFLRSKVLRNAGFEVIEAASASQALGMAAAQLPSLALIDVDLPDADGFFVCDRLKELHPELPVLLVSAVHVSASAAREGERAGADAYLREPLPPDMLVRRVNEALAGIRDEQSLNWIVTDKFGLILQASDAAAHMLNVGARQLQGRSLLIFFDQNRPAWGDAVKAASLGEAVEQSGSLRPRERRPLIVGVEMSKAIDYPQPDAVLWSFRRPTSDNPNCD